MLYLFNWLLWKYILEFKVWKERIEISTKYSWVKHSGTVVSKAVKKTIYWCNRSGKERIINQTDRKRTIKTQGSCKLNATCTSTIVMIERINEGDIKVQYFKNHYKHGVNMEHITLNESDKCIIASQLIQGL